MSSARSFLFSFKYSHKVAYVLEFSHLKIRIYAQHQLLDGSGIVLNGDSDLEVESGNETPAAAVAESEADNVETVVTASGAVEPLEIVSPYKYSDLWDEEELCCKIQTIQHSDVLYIFNEAFPIMVLKRYSPTNWVLEELELKNGPFMAMNTDNDVMIKSSAVTGVVTLTSSADVFSEQDVGRLLRLRTFSDEVTPWYAGQAVNVGDVRRSDNKYYRAGTAGSTGSTKPVHTEGVRSDGVILWTYLHDGTGLVKIISVNNSKSAQATVLSRLPDVMVDGTSCWEKGMIYQGGKYPISGAFFRNRFAFLINTETGPNVCLSYSGDYNNFADAECAQTTDETAITVPVLNTEYNEGKWLYAGDVLFVGTGASEFYIDVASGTSPLSTTNVKITQISNIGSKAIKPVAVGRHVFFADRYGLSLRELAYNYYNEGYDQVDISLLGKHLFASRIVNMCYQETPHKILWCLMGDGTLTALTFSAEQEVAALSRHDISGVAESLTVIPSLENKLDEVWLEVRRSIEGKTLRTVEWMEDGMPSSYPLGIYASSNWQDRTQREANYALQQALYLDGLVLFTRKSGDERTEIDGLEHLEGLEVQLFADGAVLPSQIVMNGKVKIKPYHVRVAVGLKIVSQFIPQHIYLSDQNGSGLGQRQRIDHVLMMFYLSGGGEIGESEETLSKIYYRPTDGKMGVPQPLFSGIKEVVFNGTTSFAGNAATLMLQNTSPLPMNVLAIVPYINV